MNEDNYDIDKYFQEIRREAAEQERAKIVAWLYRNNLLGRYSAIGIEAGEHLK